MNRALRGPIPLTPETALEHIEEYFGPAPSDEIRDATLTMLRGLAGAATLQAALRNISYSEMLALQAIFGNLPGDSGTVVSSQIADRIGITRSVFVSAMSKLASAGLITAQSIGRKGTHIKVLHPGLRAAVMATRETVQAAGD